MSELKRTQVFIDTQDIEERYGEELYKDYLERENQELKEQLENMQKMQCTFLGTGCKRKMEEYEKQQKEFIKYLEDEKISPVKCVLNSIGDKNHDYNVFKNKLDDYEKILQKYREIIGD